MVRFLFGLVLSISFSRFSDGQPLSNHRTSLEAAQMEQRLLANFRSILPKLCTCDTCGCEGPMYSENLSAMEDKIKNLTTRLGTLERQVKKQQLDTCTRLFEKVGDNATVHVFEDRCYLFVRQSLNWSNAQERCQLVGANLVSVMNKDQQDFIRRDRSAVWIGARRTMTDNKFAWIENDLLLNDTYTNWIPGQPNSDHENCVVAYFPAGWHDFPCSQIFKFICEL